MILPIFGHMQHVEAVPWANYDSADVSRFRRDKADVLKIRSLGFLGRSSGPANFVDIIISSSKAPPYNAFGVTPLEGKDFRPNEAFVGFVGTWKVDQTANHFLWWDELLSYSQRQIS